MPIYKLDDGSHLYGKDYLPYLEDSGRVAYLVLKELLKNAQEGITTQELDKIAEDEISKHKAEPLFKGFDTYPFTTCLSYNEYIVHGFPSDYKLKKGDVISIDVGVKYNGFCGDNARTIIIGGPENSIHKRLVEVAEEAFNSGLSQAYAGRTIGDIGFAIHSTVLKEEDPNSEDPNMNSKFKVFFKFQGHGIGLNLHEPPDVPNIGYPSHGSILQVGNCICIEPVVLYRSSEPVIRNSNITSVLEFFTDNMLPSSHHENQIYISESGPIILTKD